MRKVYGLLLGVILASLFTATGCGPERIYFTDGIDLDFDFNAVSDNTEAMSMPYVTGIDTVIWVHSRWEDEDFTDWTVEVDDPDVLSIDGVIFDGEVPGILGLEVTAAGDGLTELRLFNPAGKQISVADIEVADPDNAVLSPHGPLIINQPGLIEDEHSFQTLIEGTSTYEVEWYRGNTRLYGNGTLSVDYDPDIWVNIEDSFLFEERDWLQVSPGILGDHHLTLRSNDVAVQDVVFESVPESRVDEVIIHAESELGAEEDDHLVLLAQAYDEDMRPIYGVEFEWDLDGVVGEELGDLYRYTYDRSDAHTVGAYFDGLVDEVTIHGDGYVSSSNNVGCAMSGTGRGSLATLALLGIAGLVLRRRLS